MVKNSPQYRKVTKSKVLIFLSYHQAHAHSRKEFSFAFLFHPSNQLTVFVAYPPGLAPTPVDFLIGFLAILFLGSASLSLSDDSHDMVIIGILFLGSIVNFFNSLCP